MPDITVETLEVRSRSSPRSGWNLGHTEMLRFKQYLSLKLKTLENILFVMYWPSWCSVQLGTYFLLLPSVTDAHARTSIAFDLTVEIIANRGMGKKKLKSPAVDMVSNHATSLQISEHGMVVKKRTTSAGCFLPGEVHLKESNIYIRILCDH